MAKTLEDQRTTVNWFPEFETTPATNRFRMRAIV